MYRTGCRGAQSHTRAACRSHRRAPRATQKPSANVLYLGEAIADEVRHDAARFDWASFGLLLLAMATGWLAWIALTPAAKVVTP